MKKTLLVTGGTGSLGQEIVKQALDSYRRVIVFSRDEQKQWEMRCRIEHPAIRFFIGDVRDPDRLYRALETADEVIHCAALKHVHTGETSPLEVVKTTIQGAQNLIDAAIDGHCRKVLNVSTDKAVHPISLYGACKMVADKMMIGANLYSPDVTLFSCVRFGNFIGSRGSVVRKFIELKQRGEMRLPVTSFKMRRFFIDIPKAAAFALERLADMRGGEIFVPKMRELKIVDVARSIHPEAELYEVGKGRGEKFREELYPQEEFAEDRGSFWVTRA